ncbi:MAG: EsaB/YukD family protein [Eubacteriales bacterium]|nr:EsaB/YukD family protein [Eubacteriales bacterium]
MIMADVYVPSIGRQYDFSLDEQATIAHLIPEIAEVICQKENCTLGGDQEELMLCLMDRRLILDRKKSLSSYRIGNGSSLLLV